MGIKGRLLKVIAAIAIVVSVSTAQQVICYTKLDYSKNLVLGVPSSGTLIQNVDLWGEIVLSARGYTFNAVAGKAYRLTFQYSGGDDIGIFLFRNNMQNNYDDIIDGAEDGNLTFIASQTGPIRVIMFDFDGNSGGYTLTVEEDDEYPKMIEEIKKLAQEISNLPFNNNGELDEDSPIFNIFGRERYLSVYKITINDETIDISLLNGNHRLYLIDENGAVMSDVWGTDRMAFRGSGTYYILVASWDISEWSVGTYGIKVSRINNPTHYKDINYSNNASGTFTLIKDWNGRIKTGAGHSFTATAGRTYKITVEYNNAAESWWQTQAGLYVLKNTLAGNSSDVLHSSGFNWIDDYDNTATFYYKADVSGTLKILLTDERYLFELGYRIAIEESELPLINITELLNKTTKTITYGNNLAHTSRGVAGNLVSGGNNFYWNGDIVYAEAYKITLAEGNNFGIRAQMRNLAGGWSQSAEVFVFRANGSGGYTCIIREDGEDINFTAGTSGDYYIVITYWEAVEWQYYLTVWNTAERPENDFGTVKLTGAAVSAPTLASRTANSITINAVAAPQNGQTVEYAISTNNVAPASGWQNGLTFTGLTANTAYNIFARSRANDTHNAGTPSAALQITTAQNPPACVHDNTACGSVCGKCGENAISHIWSEWTTTIAPTTTTKGERTRTCSRCDTTQRQDIDMLEPSSISNSDRNANRYGIRFAQNIVREKAEITVIAECGRADPAPTVVIYDMTGNVVFECRGGVCPPSNNGAIVWDLRNQNGRFVANGTYLVIAEAKDRNGQTHRYTARLGVNR